jgi:hypothetical protein
MPIRRRCVMLLPVWGALAIVPAAPSHAAPLAPDRIAYEATANEDPSVKACMLGLAMRKDDLGEAVDFRLVVARTKRDDTFAGPVVFGFTIEVHDAQPTRRAIEINSAAFASEHYTAAARARTTPFADRSFVLATLDSAEGGALVEAALAGQFQIAYTRTRPNAVRVFAVTSAPPPDTLGRLRGCFDGLQAID